MSEILRMLDVGYTLIWRAGRLERALEGLPDDFEWVVPDHPEGAVRRGPEGVIEFFREWAEPFDDLEIEWDLHEAGADRALALIDMRGRGHESGVPVDMQFAQRGPSAAAARSGWRCSTTWTKRAAPRDSSDRAARAPVEARVARGQPRGRPC